MSGGARPLLGRRILVIEDDYLLALSIAEVLEEEGAQILGPIGWMNEALRFIKESGASCDAAVLDVNLHGKKAYPIADALAASGIGFVFVTGYGSEAIDVRYAGCVRCEKPFDEGALTDALSAMTRAVS